jgi:hypothetical protein
MTCRMCPNISLSPPSRGWCLLALWKSPFYELCEVCRRREVLLALARIVT